MAPPVEKQWQFAQRVEKELTAKLKEKDPLFEDIEHLIHQLRLACETTIFLDFDYATTHKVEAHLWDAHSVINNRYRKIVGRFKAEDKKKHVVEKRKWEKRYADFLKTSQFFYRGYIQRLASHFDCLSELKKIAHRLQLSTLSTEDRIHVSRETNHRILLSCHATLLRLGDLSRYRNVLRNKDRSWVNALAYYSLANDLYPASGTAFNQMAVISLSEGNHLDAVYHLYRALAIEEPNPVAQGNLEIEFKKITSEWANGTKKALSNGSGAPTKAGNIALPLILWFVRLHAKIYKGEEFSEHDELENEVLSQMTVLLKEQSLEGTLDKIVLVNIAAENFAAERLRAASESGQPDSELFQSYYFLLRLNIRTLFMLLQLLQPELAESGPESDVPDVTGRAQQSNTETITAVTRRILPALRQYSTWLVSRAEVINGQEGNSVINVHIKEMWSMYCSTISLLVVAFPPENLPQVEYLLEEDAETVGFKPFRDSELCDIYTTNGALKARFTDPGIERNHPNIEMLARVRDLLKDAMVLTVSTDKKGGKIAPIVLVDTEFRFVEDGLPLSSPVVSQSYQNVVDSDHPHVENVPKMMAPILPYNEERASSAAPSDSHQSMTTDMYRMVDDLVTPSEPKIHSIQTSSETSYGMHSLTANEIFTPIDLNGRPVSRHQPSPIPFPSLPGIYNSPFSPQPGELSAASPDQPSSAILFSSLQLEDRQNPDNTSTFGETSTYGSRQFTPLGTENSPSQSLLSATQHNVGKALHQSLAQQYSISSSAFSHPSSLYPSTPLLNAPRRYGGISMSRNDSNLHAGTGDFDRPALLQGSIWNSSQSVWGGPAPTTPRQGD